MYRDRSEFKKQNRTHKTGVRPKRRVQATAVQAYSTIGSCFMVIVHG